MLEMRVLCFYSPVHIHFVVSFAVDLCDLDTCRKIFICTYLASQTHVTDYDKSQITPFVIRMSDI